MKLSINIVTHNGAKYVPFLFESLRAQTHRDWMINIFDNNSDAETVNVIGSELEKFGVEQNFEMDHINHGFAKSHNILFDKTKTEYFLVLNQDVYLSKDCLRKMIYFLDNNKEVAAVSPRLMKWNFLKKKDGFSNIIDSLGLKLLRNRRVVEIEVNKKWDGGSNKKSFSKVFGVSGTCTMYRKEYVNKVLFEDSKLFDDAYFMYKEDVDLAYRLQSSGFSSAVLLDICAYHDRSGSAGKKLSDKVAAINKRKQNRLVRYCSYKNHLATIYKNEYKENFKKDFLYIFWYEFKKFIYFLFLDTRVLKGLYELYKERTDLCNKRAQIVARRKITWQEFRKLFIDQ